MKEIQVKGADELARTLRKVGEGLEDLTEPNRDAAEIAARASAALAPVRTGRLKRTIAASGSRAAAIVRAGNRSVPYAPPIHWGWPGRNIIPQPFLSDGVKDSEGRWIPVYEDYVDEYLHTVKGA